MCAANASERFGRSPTRTLARLLLAAHRGACMRATRERSRRSVAAASFSGACPSFAHERSCCARAYDACVSMCNECMCVHVCVGALRVPRDRWGG